MSNTTQHNLMCNGKDCTADQYCTLDWYYGIFTRTGKLLEKFSNMPQVHWGVAVSSREVECDQCGDTLCHLCKASRTRRITKAKKDGWLLGYHVDRVTPKLYKKQGRDLLVRVA